MAKRRKPGWVVIGASVLGTLATLVVGALIVVLTGSYDVAASSEHSGLGGWAFETTMENSVRRRAAGLEPPAPFTAADAAAGAVHYRDVCQHCHGGPGVRRSEWAEGLNPGPPELARAAGEWRAGELFWIVRNGIRMTGMPAIGAGHSDRDVWDVVAFVERLPRMTEEEYRAAVAADRPRPHGELGHRH